MEPRRVQLQKVADLEPTQKAPEPRRVQLQTIQHVEEKPNGFIESQKCVPTTSIDKPEPKKKPTTGSIRLTLTLKEPSDFTYQEFSYLKLVKEHKLKVEEKDKNPFAESDQKEDDRLKALADSLEQKYGIGYIKDLIDIGDGYDLEDPFIDNTDVYDEVIPYNVMTKLGGFYINSGRLDFTMMREAQDGSMMPVKKKKRKRPAVIEEDIEDEAVAPKKKKMSPLARPDVKKKKKKLNSFDTVQNITPNEECKKDTSTTSEGEHKNGTLISRIQHLADTELTSSKVDTVDTEDNSKSKEEAVPVLPDTLSLQLLLNIDKLKDVASSRTTEGKSKFFSDDVNKLLLSVECDCRGLRCSERTIVYTHLAAFLPCGKQTLIKRAQRLLTKQCDEVLKEPIEKLKKAVSECMPALVAKHQQECAATEQAKQDRQAEERQKQAARELIAKLSNEKAGLHDPEGGLSVANHMLQTDTQQCGRNEDDIDRMQEVGDIMKCEGPAPESLGGDEDLGRSKQDGVVKGVSFAKEEGQNSHIDVIIETEVDEGHNLVIDVIKTLAETVNRDPSQAEGGPKAETGGAKPKTEEEANPEVEGAKPKTEEEATTEISEVKTDTEAKLEVEGEANSADKAAIAEVLVGAKCELEGGAKPKVEEGAKPEVEVGSNPRVEGVAKLEVEQGAKREENKESKVEGGVKTETGAGADTDSMAKLEAEGELKQKRIVAPRKKFEWISEVRTLLCDIVEIKLKQYDRLKVKGQAMKEYLEDFLESEIRVLWPLGWMHKRTLMNQSREIHTKWIDGKSQPRKSSKSGSQSDTTGVTSSHNNQEMFKITALTKSETSSRPTWTTTDIKPSKKRVAECVKPVTPAVAPAVKLKSDRTVIDLTLDSPVKVPSVSQSLGVSAVPNHGTLVDSGVSHQVATTLPSATKPPQTKLKSILKQGRGQPSGDVAASTCKSASSKPVKKTSLYTEHSYVKVDKRKLSDMEAGDKRNQAEDVLTISIPTEPQKKLSILASPKFHIEQSPLVNDQSAISYPFHHTSPSLSPPRKVSHVAPVSFNTSPTLKTSVDSRSKNLSTGLSIISSSAQYKQAELSTDLNYSRPIDMSMKLSTSQPKPTAGINNSSNSPISAQSKTADLKTSTPLQYKHVDLIKPSALSSAASSKYGEAPVKSNNLPTLSPPTTTSPSPKKSSSPGNLKSKLYSPSKSTMQWQADVPLNTGSTEPKVKSDVKDSPSKLTSKSTSVMSWIASQITSSLPASHPHNPGGQHVASAALRSAVDVPIPVSFLQKFETFTQSDKKQVKDPYTEVFEELRNGGEAILNNPKPNLYNSSSLTPPVPYCKMSPPSGGSFGWSPEIVSTKPLFTSEQKADESRLASSRHHFSSSQTSADITSSPRITDDSVSIFSQPAKRHKNSPYTQQEQDYFDIFRSPLSTQSMDTHNNQTQNQSFFSSQSIDNSPVHLGQPQSGFIDRRTAAGASDFHTHGLQVTGFYKNQFSNNTSAHSHKPNYAQDPYSNQSSNYTPAHSHQVNCAQYPYSNQSPDNPPSRSQQPNYAQDPYSNQSPDNTPSRSHQPNYAQDPYSNQSSNNSCAMSDKSKSQESQGKRSQTKAPKPTQPHKELKLPQHVYKAKLASAKTQVQSKSPTVPSPMYSSKESLRPKIKTSTSPSTSHVISDFQSPTRKPGHTDNLHPREPCTPPTAQPAGFHHLTPTQQQQLQELKYPGFYPNLAHSPSTMMNMMSTVNWLFPGHSPTTGLAGPGVRTPQCVSSSPTHNLPGSIYPSMAADSSGSIHPYHYPAQGTSQSSYPF